MRPERSRDEEEAAAAAATSNTVASVQIPIASSARRVRSLHQRPLFDHRPAEFGTPIGWVGR